MILTIELNDLKLEFGVLDHPVAKLWVERMLQRTQWPLDDPKRFYGFNSPAEEERIATDKITECIANINSYRPPLIKRPFTNVRDQDTLNYLHSIFERWHGLLNQQLERPIPPELKQHLAELNISVHRCESVARGNRPRFVCTWFGMPKTETLSEDLMKEYGTLNPKFGSVCLNYAEVGKTLEDLVQDRDNYISNDAFKPFNHYSADFTVRFHEETVEYSADKLLRMQEYYNQHREFFYDRGYTLFQDTRLLPLRFPVAELVETQPRDQLLEAIKQHQHVTQVILQ